MANDSLPYQVEAWGHGSAKALSDPKVTGQLESDSELAACDAMEKFRAINAAKIVLFMMSPVNKLPPDLASL